MRRWALVIGAAALVASCNSGSVAAPPATAVTTPIITTTSVSPTSTPSRAETPTTTTQHRPRFQWHGNHVTAAQLGKSWHSGCPVGPSRLRKLTMTYWGFDHAAHTGHLVVRASIVSDIVTAFHAMYHGKFPIRRMRPVSVYDGDDNVSMRHDNTSAFNCRYAVSSGPKHWSMHAYGEAVDINTVENPYKLDGRVRPKKGEPYMDRSNVRPGMIVSGSVPLNVFTKLGWGWGGNWSSSPDYQHFSTTGG
jgi:hypothetical protein